MLLTDKEIERITRRLRIIGWASNDADRAIAKAQLKKVVEFIDWLDNGLRSSASWRSEVRILRQSLLEEVR